MAKQVKITWTQSTGNTVAPTSHIVQRSATENGTYTTIYTALGVTAEHIDVNVLDGETWWYRVGAVFASGTIKYLAAEDITISETASIILLEDTFAGTTISTVKWTVTDSADTIDITQNDNLLITMTSQGNVPWADNMLESKVSIDETQFAAVLKPVSITGGEDRERGLMVISDLGSTAFYVRGDTNNITTQVFARDSAGTSLIALTDYAVQFEGKTWRILHKSNTVYFQYYDSGWTTLDSIATAGLLDSDLIMQIRSAGNNIDTAGGVVTIGAAYITSDEFTPETPV